MNTSIGRFEFVYNREKQAFNLQIHHDDVESSVVTLVRRRSDIDEALEIFYIAREECLHKIKASPEQIEELTLSMASTMQEIYVAWVKLQVQQCKEMQEDASNARLIAAYKDQTAEQIQESKEDTYQTIQDTPGTHSNPMTVDCMSILTLLIADTHIESFYVTLFKEYLDAISHKIARHLAQAPNGMLVINFYGAENTPLKALLPGGQNWNPPPPCYTLTAQQQLLLDKKIYEISYTTHGQCVAKEYSQTLTSIKLLHIRSLEFFGMAFYASPHEHPSMLHGFGDFGENMRHGIGALWMMKDKDSKSYVIAHKTKMTYRFYILEDPEDILRVTEDLWSTWQHINKTQNIPQKNSVAIKAIIEKWMEMEFKDIIERDLGITDLQRLCIDMESDHGEEMTHLIWKINSIFAGLKAQRDHVMALFKLQAHRYVVSTMDKVGTVSLAIPYFWHDQAGQFIEIREVQDILKLTHIMDQQVLRGLRNSKKYGHNAPRSQEIFETLLHKLDETLLCRKGVGLTEQKKQQAYDAFQEYHNRVVGPQDARCMIWESLNEDKVIYLKSASNTLDGIKLEYAGPKSVKATLGEWEAVGLFEEVIIQIFTDAYMEYANAKSNGVLGAAEQQTELIRTFFKEFLPKMNISRLEMSTLRELAADWVMTLSAQDIDELATHAGQKGFGRICATLFQEQMLHMKEHLWTGGDNLASVHSILDGLEQEMGTFLAGCMQAATVEAFMEARGDIC